MKAQKVFNVNYLTTYMVIIVVSANFLVQYPVNDWLTWGAITYPVAFLITDVANRFHGPKAARHVLYFGFIFAVVISTFIATPRIAMASGTAFLIAQLLDVYIFDSLRNRIWWQAPLVSSLMGSAIDTALFFSIAFYGTDFPWVTVAIGDFGVKVALALLLIIPFGAIQSSQPKL